MPLKKNGVLCISQDDDLKRHFANLSDEDWADHMGYQEPPAPAPRRIQAAINENVMFGLAAQEDVKASAGDMVNMPAHYARFAIEPMHFSVVNKLNPLQHSIIKYILRFDAKNGKEDLLKARRCLDMLIKFNDGDPDWWKKEEEKA